LRRSIALRIAAAWLAIAVVAALLASLAGGGNEKPLTPAQKRAKRADVGGPFPLELRSPQVVAGTSARVLVALRRPSLAELVASEPQSPTRQRAYIRSLHREERALMSALTAKGVTFGQPVLFARVWSGFAATIATKDLPEVQTLGLRVEPVSRFYPAQVPAKDAPGARPLPTTASDAGPVAILDAFPPSRDSASGPRIAADEVGRVGNGKRSAGEQAGRRLAAVVAGELPKARVIGIRAAGSQALENGRFQVFATTDQLIAGLERVVDLDGNGDSSDAAPVALTGLSAPYSGFDNSPAAEAVDGAARLGTLVVAAAGNGGEPDGAFGSIGAPGAAPLALTVGALDGSGDPAQASSRGPTYGLGAKPDLAISGGASTGAGTAWGTAIAAARVAGVAAALRAERPRLSPSEAAFALIGTAAPRGEPFAAGGGDPLLQAARAARVVADPPQLVLRPGESATIRLRAIGARSAIAVKPPKDLILRGQTPTSGGQTLRVAAPADAKATAGRIEAGPIAIPFQVVAGEPPPPPLGSLRIITRSGKADGVRFTAGSIKRGDTGASVIPVGNLVLTLTGPGRRELTPPGGARDLLPGEYAYTLTDEIKSALPAGRYRFVVRARGTAGGQAVERRSRSFDVG
jgi:subtilase family protein